MGITGCCNKSENENITSSPASFLLIHNFCTVLLREIGVGQSMPYPGRPSQARTVPPASARCRRAATSAAQWRKFEREKRANRKCRAEKRERERLEIGQAGACPDLELDVRSDLGRDALGQSDRFPISSAAARPLMMDESIAPGSSTRPRGLVSPVMNEPRPNYDAFGVDRKMLAPPHNRSARH